MATFKAWWGGGDRKRRREAEEIPGVPSALGGQGGTKEKQTKENKMEVVTDKFVTGGIVYVTRNDPCPDPAGLYILQKSVQGAWWAWNLWSGEFIGGLDNPCTAKSMGFQIRLERSGEDYGTGWHWITNRKGKEQSFRAQTEAIRLVGL